MSSFQNHSASNEELNVQSASSDLQSWQRRIRDVQERQVTPDILQSLRDRADRQRRAAKASKRATRLAEINKVSAMSNAQALRGWSTSAENSMAQSIEAAPSENVLASTHARYIGRSSTIQRCLTAFQSKSAAPVILSHAPDASANTGGPEFEDDEDDTEVDLALNALHNEIALERAAEEAPRALIAAGITADSGTEDIATEEIDILLAQLAREPRSESEMSAKFQLFENFLATVTTIREETLNFWAANKDQFLGATREDGERSIRAIDSADAMGIDTSCTDKWFVYYMTQKANNNNRKITATLAAVRARLDLLSQELGECPFCLDQLESDTCTTLGCCHKACNTCWDHWVSIKGPSAFCPLCKHQEFVEEIIREFPAA